MVAKTEYYVAILSRVYSFREFKDASGETHRIPIGPTKVGPFDMIYDATNWIEEHFEPLSTYSIETVSNPRNT